MKWIVPAEGNMRRVVIERGWLLDQFAQHVLGLSPDDYAYKSQLWLSDVNESLAQAIVKYDLLVEQKNKQYKDAWQVDGPLTALTDLKDKLYRLESLTEKNINVSWDKDKLTGTLYDILVRTIMCLAWLGLNFEDDDDDRKGKQE